MTNMDKYNIHNIFNNFLHELITLKNIKTSHLTTKSPENTQPMQNVQNL